VNVDGANPGSFDLPQFVDLDGNGLLDIYHPAAVYLNQGLVCEPPESPAPTPAPPRVLLAYPNPSGPSQPMVRLTYDLSRGAKVRVTLRDVQGRVVRHLFVGVAGPGELRLQWDRRDDSGRLVPAGVYLHRIETPGQRQGGRIVVIR
jgi:hypothetical protein